MVKRWVTGEKAEMEQEDVEREVFELAREWMEVSKLTLRSFPAMSQKKLMFHCGSSTVIASRRRAVSVSGRFDAL